jgi:signal transduction histidine kinase
MIENYKILNDAKILIVDDIADNIKLLGQNLKKYGVNISIASNGLQAINITNKIKPDLILMDISMPELNGLDATKIILANEETNHIPIIFLTALAAEDDIIKGFEIGGVDYVTKPFNAKILLQRIKTHLQIKFQKDRIAEQNSKLKLADIEKNKFLSIVSHDLKSPFTGIIGLMQIINDEYDTLDDETKKEYIHSINESIKNQFEFLDNLLSWSKIQFGKAQVNKMDLDLNLLIDRIFNLLQLNADSKEISLVKDIKASNIYGDVNMLYSVFHNLITNSLKFTSEKGKITFKSEEKDNKVILSIKDNGIGMNEVIKNSLFKIDEVRSRPGTNEEPGTGLGLILCKEIIEQHKGTIRVESEEGVGSEFIIELPINNQ